MSERRYIKIKNAEIRLSNGDNAKGVEIVGYAAVFNQPIDRFGLEEVIMPGAFTRVIEEEQDVRALIDHDSRLLLGRTKSGTLSLKEDDIGLAVTIKPPRTSFADDVIESIKRGDLDGMSFAFIAKKQTFIEEDDKTIRQLHDLDVEDVSIVTFPANEGTSVNLRSGLNTNELNRLMEWRSYGMKLGEADLEFVKKQIELLAALLPKVEEQKQEKQREGLSLLECAQRLVEAGH